MTAGRIIAESLIVAGWSRAKIAARVAELLSTSVCDPNRRRSIRTNSAVGSASALRWRERSRRGHG
jgi:hypothetical protein